MDKSAATWWDNLKLSSIASMTWNYFVQEFKDQNYTHFYKDQKDKNFLNLKSLGGRIVTEYETKLGNYQNLSLNWLTLKSIYIPSLKRVYP